VPANGHEVSGVIKAVGRGNITLSTRGGALIRVDAAEAMRNHRSVVLLVGEPVTVFGGDDGSGLLHAMSVLHAKPSPKGWPPDR
jgi:hypothetical protein